MPEELAPISGMAAVNGAHLYYEVAGQGEALVLIHAGITDNRMWDDQFNFFAEEFRVIRYDMRGYGRSPTVPGSYSRYLDLQALLDYLHLDRVHLLGCSVGGNTVIDFALAFPGRTTSLIAVGSVPNGYDFGPSPYLPPQWQAAKDAFEQGDLARAAELEVQIWVDGPQRTAVQVDARVRRRVQEMNLIALRNEKLGLDEERFLSPTASDRLAEIQVPCLIMVGELDDPDLVAAAPLIAQSIPSASLLIMPETAHLPNMEQPGAFNDHVMVFLRYHSNGP